MLLWGRDPRTRDKGFHRLRRKKEKEKKMFPATQTPTSQTPKLLGLLGNEG